MTDETMGVENAEIAESNPVADSTETETPSEEGQPIEEDIKPEGEEVKKKKSSGWHRKITRLEREKAELLQEVNRLKTPAAATLDEEPQLENFTDWNSYNKAAIQYGVNQALKKQQIEQQKHEIAKKRIEEASTWEQKVAELVDSDDEYEDYYDIVDKYKDTEINPIISQALAKHGPKLAHYLGKNGLVEELNNKDAYTIFEKINEITPLLNNPKPTVNKVSKSSPPINPVKGSTKTAVKLDALDTSSYLAQRHPHLLKRK